MPCSEEDVHSICCSNVNTLTVAAAAAAQLLLHWPTCSASLDVNHYSASVKAHAVRALERAFHV